MRLEKNFPISSSLSPPYFLPQMFFNDLFIGFFQFIQKRSYCRTAVQHFGFLDINIVDRYMEYIGQRTNNFDKASLSVTEHDNPAFMNGNSKLQQFLLRSNP